jgi:hypothetical protein
MAITLVKEQLKRIDTGSGRLTSSRSSTQLPLEMGGGGGKVAWIGESKSVGDKL